MNAPLLILTLHSTTNYLVDRIQRIYILEIYTQYLSRMINDRIYTAGRLRRLRRLRRLV